MNVALFYRYYLKRLFKSWFFWVYSILALLIVFGSPLYLYKILKFTREDFSITNYKDFLKLISGVKIFQGKYGDSSKFFKNNPFGIFTSVFRKFALSSGKSYNDILTAVWKLTCLGLTGVLITSFLVIPAISSLISRSQNNGDDETALTLVSPIKRDDLIIGKLLAFLSLFLITIFLTFVFPYTVYYYLVVDSISWSVLTTFLLGSLIFAIPIFLLFYAVLFLLDSISTWLRRIFGFLISLVSHLWFMAKNTDFFFREGGKKTIEQLSKFGSNFWIIVPLALVIGGLFLFLYRERFRKKDF
jgi:hypothetical protein